MILGSVKVAEGALSKKKLSIRFVYSATSHSGSKGRILTLIVSISVHNVLLNIRNEISPMTY